jgi:LAGLIDADG endonuclease
LTQKLNKSFPNTVPVDRPEFLASKIIDPNWLSGFTNGEGCFLIKIFNSKTHNLGFQVLLWFSLVQHSRDKYLMTKIKEYLGGGKLYKRANLDRFEVNKLLDIKNKIIPWFIKYLLHGSKNLDFLDFIKAAKIMETKSHLTQEGLDLIHSLKIGMNTSRKYKRN